MADNRYYETANARLDVDGRWAPPACADSWLEVDMLNVYTVIGFTSNTNGLTSYDLKLSTDGINYQYMYQNAEVSVNVDIIHWFENPTQAKYWRLEHMVCFTGPPFVQGDIIGHL